jgi:hypothetical protein
MKGLLYLVIAALLFPVLIMAFSLLWMGVGLASGIVAMLAESVTVGAAHFACYFVSEQRASRIEEWLNRNGVKP